MLQRLKLTTIQLFNDTNSRAIFVLSVILVAVLAGAAPNDMT